MAFSLRDSAKSTGTPLPAKPSHCCICIGAKRAAVRCEALRGAPESAVQARVTLLVGVNGSSGGFEVRRYVKRRDVNT